MSIERLERVMWRLRKNTSPAYNPTNKELRLAIYKECGISPMTVRRNRAVLIDLGWIKPVSRQRIKLTGKDLNE